MRADIRIIDNTTGRTIARRFNEDDAHRRVDILNGAYGWRRFRVLVPGQEVGLD